MFSIYLAQFNKYFEASRRVTAGVQKSLENKVFTHKATVKQLSDNTCNGTAMVNGARLVVLKPTNGPKLTDPTLDKRINPSPIVIRGTPTRSVLSTSRNTVSVSSSNSSQRSTPIGPKNRRQTPEQPVFIDLDDAPSQDDSRESGDEQRGPVVKKIKKEPSASENDQAIVEYHAERRNEHIPIYKFDLDCLVEREFLNDTILSFYLA